MEKDCRRGKGLSRSQLDRFGGRLPGWRIRSRSSMYAIREGVKEVICLECIELQSQGMVGETIPAIYLRCHVSDSTREQAIRIVEGGRVLRRVC